MQLKLVGEIFCHLKTAFFGQKWSEIKIFLKVAEDTHF